MKKLRILSILILATFGTITETLAYEEGDWIIRFGATNVSPDDSSSNVFVGTTDVGVGVRVGDNTQLGINVAYFFSSNWALELLAATPFEHDIDLGTIRPLGKTKHLPPTLTANYYFSNANSNLQPYAGLGINYTIFFEDNFVAAGPGGANAGFSDLKLDNSLGFSAQLGLDYIVNEKWHVNTSVRWIDIDTEATFNLNGTQGRIDDIEIDPYVYTLSVGYNF